MIIGHFYEDGTYPEPVDLSNKRRYFELWHEHVDALHLFKPHYPIPKNIMRKYEKMWEGYLKERDEYNKENHFNSPI